MPSDFSSGLQRSYGCSPVELSSLRARYNRLLQLFNATFAASEQVFVVRAPGRVNLIGEHTDYNGYPVLPVALDRDIAFVVAPSSGRSVDLINENAAFNRRTFVAEFPLAPYQQGDWGNYVKAAIHGILEAGMVDRNRAIGFNAVVGGTIPESAGLSSSSAMVVASALAFLAVNNVKFDRKLLADLLAHAERYVGSEGGGMDQAVSLLAEPGRALRIDFFPLRTEPVPLLKEITFVVCNSLVRAPKSENARYAFNRRVVECRLANALISEAIRRKTGKIVRAVHLADLVSEDTRLTSAELQDATVQAIGEQPLPLRAVAERLAKNPREVERAYCTLRDGSILREPSDGFRVWNRYRHVVTEAERVISMVRAFREADPGKIGELMNQSHASCRDDYEISCPELEVLVSLGREHGALGARLTGAGFGGCTVHAVRTERVDDFIHCMVEAYYHGFVRQELGRDFARYEHLRDVIFPCRAAGGADFWLAEGNPG